MEERYMDGQIDTPNLNSLCQWLRSRAGFCLPYKGQPTHPASGSIWIPERPQQVFIQPQSPDDGGSHSCVLTGPPSSPGLRLLQLPLHVEPSYSSDCVYAGPQKPQVNSRPCNFGRKSIHNYVFCLCSMAQSQADWELDKVEIEGSRLTKQTGGHTPAQWKELGQSDHLLALIAFSLEAAMS